MAIRDTRVHNMSFLEYITMACTHLWIVLEFYCMLECILVMIGGAIGALVRYGVTKMLPTEIFPSSTFAVNITGSFLIGLFSAVIIKYGVTTVIIRHLIIIGFLGSLTTFSTFSLDLVKLLDCGNYFVCIIYLVFSVVLGLCSAFVGMKLIS